MSHPKNADLEQLLTLLVEGQVEFIVVGGVAAVLQGAPVTTQDLDIVHQRTQENVDKLIEVLKKIDAVVRPDFAGRKLRPEPEHLLGHGHLNLSTELGPLDPLCELTNGRGYDELISHTDQMVDGKISIRILDLPTLIQVKQETGRAKDKLVVPILVALLEERSKQKD